jgi:O-antigen ligase
MMELSLKQKLFYFFPVLFCFCLPFGSRLLGLLAACWVVVSFFNIEKAQLFSGLKNRNLWLIVLFFIVTVASALFSSNKAEAFFSVEVKLSLLFFPFLLFCFHWPQEILKRFIVAFVSGCFFACLYLITRALYYSVNGQPEYFFYTLFSELIHASYFAMYLILAIVLVILFYHQWFKSQKSVLISSYVFVAVFIITIFLCSSKLGIISLFICLPLSLFYTLKHRLTVKTISALVIGIGILLFVSVKIFPESFARLKSITELSETPDKTASESTAVRILIWKQSLALIKQNVLFGTGVGDANDRLYKAYEQNGMTGALKHRLNAHNQFFQTFIGLGLIGFIVLLLLTFGQLIKSMVQKNYLLFIFSLLICLNFLVESMLQTSAGILFFTFFLCVFNLSNEKKLSSE